MAWIEGTDVSHWQRPSLATAQRLRAEGVRYAWVKVSQGRAGKDVERFAHHRVFGEAGITRGAYHFCDFGSSAAANAANMVAAMTGLTFELPAVIDAEHGGLGKQATAEWLLDLAERLEAELGRRPIFYTYASWWNGNVAPVSAFKDYRLWVARYPNAYVDGEPPPVTADTAPAEPWDAWAVWQYSTTHGTLDRNVATPTSYALLVGAPTPPTPPTGGLHMDADVKARFDRIEAAVADLARLTDRKAVALRSKKDGKVWIVSEDGRWHVPDMETLNLLIFTGQVHGFGTDGVPEVDESQLDGIRVLDALK